MTQVKLHDGTLKTIDDREAKRMISAGEAELVQQYWTNEPPKEEDKPEEKPEDEPDEDKKSGDSPEPEPAVQ